MVRRFLLVLTLVSVTTISFSASASMRCGTQLIDEGDLIADVLRKCGQPAQREVIPAASTTATDKKFNAVNVENWIYGPSNGVYQYLRFIDGKLVQIRTGRG